MRQCGGMQAAALHGGIVPPLAARMVETPIAAIAPLVATYPTLVVGNLPTLAVIFSSHFAFGICCSTCVHACCLFRLSLVGSPE